MARSEIVVGVDGSASGNAALGWAMREAGLRSATVRAVLAYDWGWAAGRFADTEQLRRMVENDADTTLADAVLLAAKLAPEVTVHRQLAPGGAASALLAASDNAAMVVVGNRGRGGFGSLLLGSVSHGVATQAGCPVVVVRGRPDAADGPVVVGTDGSSHAEHAVEVALVLAAERGSDLVAIRAYPPPAAPWRDETPPHGYDRAEREQAERGAVNATLAPWRDKFPQVAVETVVAQGSAARILVGRSHTAWLVAVAYRGHGGLAGTQLGSVGHQLIHHSDCPVLITRPPRGHVEKQG